MNGRFGVVVKSTQQLFKLFSDGRGLINFGEIPLSGPIKKMEIAARAVRGEFSLIATIFPASILDIDRSVGNYSFAPPYSHLKSRFKMKEFTDSGCGSAYIYDEEGNVDSIISLNLANNWISIEQGSSGAAIKKISTAADFKKDILRFAEIVETTVNGLYAQLGQNAPNVNFEILPPDLSEDFNLSEVGSRIDDKTAVIKATDLPHVSFDDLGGQDSLKEELMAVSMALKKPELYKKWGGAPSKGYILAGPPGVGKTLAARILAGNVDAAFYDVNLAEIFTMWYGKSSQNIDKVFSVAYDNRPSVIFFDEIDALASTRDQSSHEESVRVISVILKRMSDLKPQDGVLVLAATNRLEAVDPAFLRPGRIDKIINVPMPDEKGRRQIFEIYRQKAEKLADRKVFIDVDWELVSSRAEKMSGAEIAEVVRRTLEEKIRQELKGKKPDSVSTRDLLAQIDSYERRGVSRRIGF